MATEELITAKEAGIAVKGNLEELREGSSPIDFVVEEVELDESEGYWRVVCSYLENFLSSKKTFKEFKVDAESGEILSMKNR